MAEQKDGDSTRGDSTRPETSNASRRAARASSDASSNAGDAAGRTSDQMAETSDEAGRSPSGLRAPRKHRYLIGIRSFPGLVTSPADTILATIERMEDVEVLGRVQPKGFKGLAAGSMPGTQEIVVVRMDERRATVLRQSAPPHVVIERDAPLRTGEAAFAAPVTGPWSERMLPVPRLRQEIRFRVLGANSEPLARAGITVFLRGAATQAVTDSSGAASIDLFDPDGRSGAVDAVYVQPASGHWESYVVHPILNRSEVNLVTLKPLSMGAGKPSETPRRGWAQEAMGLDRLTPGWAGAGTKIALIDSGCDHSHPMLRHITRGVDLTGNGGKDWMKDEIGQGTHCAGIIAGIAGIGAGNGAAAHGASGIAPEAEIHIFKVSPGGRCGNLIEALDQCLERQIDIVHIGIGGELGSELVAEKIIEARLRGTACIMGTGDEGGLVQFPAMIPGVLAVAALGRLGTFPQETRHALTAISAPLGPGGQFIANFSGTGPQVGVCAPGVAVISSVPGGGLAARDGTATAAAHVTGLAALVLAHHPLLRGASATRNEQRVDALFELVRRSALPPVFDRARVGAGLPDIRRIPGLGLPDAEAWSSVAQNFGSFASMRGVADMMPGGIGYLPPNLADAMAVWQLRAAGLM